LWAESTLSVEVDEYTGKRRALNNTEELNVEAREVRSFAPPVAAGLISSFLKVLDEMPIRLGSKIKCAKSARMQKPQKLCKTLFI
jgi:hypothetical protein